MEESYEEKHHSPCETVSYLEEVKEGLWGPGFGEGIEIMLLKFCIKACLNVPLLPLVLFARKQKASVTASAVTRVGLCYN